MDASRYNGLPQGTVLVEHQRGMAFFPYCVRKISQWGVTDGTLCPDNPLERNTSYKLDSQLPGDGDYVIGVNVYVKKSPQEAINDAFKDVKPEESERAKMGREQALSMIKNVLITSDLPHAIRNIHGTAQYWFQESVKVKTEIEATGCGDQKYNHFQHTWNDHFDFVFAMSAVFIKATDVLTELYGA